MNKLNRILTNVSALAGMCLLLFAVSANAATLTVTNTNDSGPGSLRQALVDSECIYVANDIVFAIPTTDPNYNSVAERFTIMLSSELYPCLYATTTIKNAMSQAVTIRGNNLFRIFDLSNTHADVVMTNLTISHGDGMDGGAIYMNVGRTLTLNDCTISNNTAEYNGGAIFVEINSTLNINRSTITGNSSSSGGAIFVNNGAALNLNSSTLSGNSATSDNGGAIYNNGSMNAVNNTFSGNLSPNGVGGAIINWGTMTLTSNTLVENESQWGGGIYNVATAPATLNNNIVALNVASEFSRGMDLYGTFSGNHNLIGLIEGSTGMAIAPNIWGDNGMGSLNPMIGPLANNGGPTFTRALLTGSPAIDQGNSPIHTTDQRGYGRYDNLSVSNATDGTDIGAFEALAPSAANVSIGGQFITSHGKGGQGIAGVTVYLTDEAGNVQTARTNAFGYYEFPEVAAGMTYIATARHRQYQFESKAVSVNEQIADLNWTPMITAAATNRTSKSGHR